jgi:hypothetical protein
MSLAEARYCLAIFSGLILKNLFSVKNLRVQLFLPWVLKIRLHPLFPSKKNSKYIILSFYQNWCEKARSKLCYPRPHVSNTDKKARSFNFPRNWSAVFTILKHVTREPVLLCRSQPALSAQCCQLFSKHFRPEMAQKFSRYVKIQSLCKNSAP